MQGRPRDEEDLAMDLAAEGGLSLVVQYQDEVVAALVGTAVAAPTPGMAVMQLQLVAVNPHHSDAAEVCCLQSCSSALHQGLTQLPILLVPEASFRLLTCLKTAQSTC